MKSHMDGSGREVLVRGLKKPVGVLFLRELASKIFVAWVDSAMDQFGIISLSGTSNSDHIPPLQFPNGFMPRNVATDLVSGYVGARNAIYVLEAGPTLEVIPVYNSTVPINSLFMPSLPYSFYHTNDCEGKFPHCETICLLTPEGSRCLPK